jgi:hypothetical protein
MRGTLAVNSPAALAIRAQDGLARPGDGVRRHVGFPGVPAIVKRDCVADGIRLAVLNRGGVPAHQIRLRVDDLEAVHGVNEAPGGEGGKISEHGPKSRSQSDPPHNDGLNQRPLIRDSREWRSSGGFGSFGGAAGDPLALPPAAVVFFAFG